MVWLDPAQPDAPDRRPTLLGPHLYGGTAGIALFLAALARATGRGDFAAAARGVLEGLRRQLSHLARNPEQAARFQFRLGGMVGLGAYVYVFLRVARWLDEPALAQAAADAASLISPERIAADDSLDVVQGSAGAILALLLFAREAPESAVREMDPLPRAIACGEHLLRRRAAHDGEPLAWPAGGYRPWCGFAHGAAGICFALAELGYLAGRADFVTAAEQGLAFERHHYAPERRNWPDLRGAAGRFMTTWCQGAPGIALGRLGLLGRSRDEVVERELRLALETTRAQVRTDRDFVCCGNMGRADILLQAARALSDPDLAAAAERLADKVVAAARERGSYHWALPGEQFAPAFFTGAAGVGYTLLRLGDPTLPCVLCLE